MRETMGGSLLMNLIIIFAGIVILFFVTIMAYSKAYRVKNRIIEIIEKNEAYNTSAQSEINGDLKKIGYRSTQNKKCTSDNLNNTAYNYCVYRVENTQSTSTYYYKVVTYIQFEFPVIGSYITFPVQGETKILGNNYNY